MAFSDDQLLAPHSVARLTPCQRPMVALDALLESIPAYPGAGVYAIRNVRTRKGYIGSTREMRRRLRGHIRILAQGKHRNRHLQGAWDQDGPGNFAVEVLERCSPSRLLERERYWMRRRRSRNDRYGYNFADPVASVGRTREYVVYGPRGGVYRIRNLHRFCCRRGLNSANLTLVAQGKKHSDRGWACRYAEMPEREWLRRRPKLGLVLAEYVAYSPDGDEFTVDRLAQFCRKHGLTLTCMLNVAKGRQWQHRGWRCCRLGERPVSPEPLLRVRTPDGRRMEVRNVKAFAATEGLAYTSIFHAVNRGRPYRGYRFARLRGRAG